MSNNNVINEKKKALIAYKEKILNEIKYYERSIEDFRSNHKNNYFDDYVDSSDSEDDFPHTIDTGPSIQQLKQQETLLNTCLHATQELTSVMVLQSQVEVLVTEPTFQGERPVTEAGTWREVIAECRIDLVPFTISFYMHTPDRKFAAPSYRGLRVVPVKKSHEMELAKSVLHSLTAPSDAVEVLRNYAAGYRSRRTTLARLANKYGNALFMEPHNEGGFVLKCADLLEVLWKLENKWSPVAPFHHRMKFDLEYMDESYIKIITQNHKQLLDPAIQTDERTLLLAKIINTCLEARGPVDPESDLESKTTEIDNDIEKRDSEVMAPPKTLPKKVRQKYNLAQKRASDDVDSGLAKKMRNDNDEGSKDAVENPPKSKISEAVNEVGKKRKIGDSDNVASGKNVKETGNTDDGNPKTKIAKETDAIDNGTSNINAKSKNLDDNPTKTKKKMPETTDAKIKKTKDSENNENKNPNTKTKVNEAGDTVTNDNVKSKNTKQSENIEHKNTKTKKNITNDNADIPKDDNAISKNAKQIGNSEDKNPKTKTKKKVMNEADDNDGKTKNTKQSEISDDKITKTKKKVAKESDTVIKNGNSESKTIKTKKSATIKSTNNDKIESAALKQKNTKITEKVIRDTNIDKTKSTKNNNTDNAKTNNTENNDKLKCKENVDSNKITKKVDKNPKPKTIQNENNAVSINNINKNIEPSKIKNTISKNDNQVKNTKNKEKLPGIINKNTEKANITQTVKKVTEKNATNIKNKDKIAQIKIVENITKPDKVISSNAITKKDKEITNKNIIKKPAKALPYKISSHRLSLKAQNPPKILKAGNTNMLNTGNTEKENGGLATRIPQKKVSSISEGSSKKMNNLRISPRKLPSKFKSSQDTFKQKMMKSTNIPRLLKKPVPKTST